MADLIQFDIGSGSRIARAVRVVEGMYPAAKPLTLGAIAEPSRKGFRIATFTGAWSKNATKVVTYKYQTATPNTAVALNLFADIGTSSSTRNCAIAREGTAWFLIAAEC